MPTPQPDLGPTALVHVEGVVVKAAPRALVS